MPRPSHHGEASSRVGLYSRKVQAEMGGAWGYKRVFMSVQLTGVQASLLKLVSFICKRNG